MASMVVSVVLAALLTFGEAAESAANTHDLRRAKTKKPRDNFRGDDQSAMSKVLNGHLMRAEKNWLPCNEWSTKKLQDFMAHVADHRSDELQKVYELSKDRRVMRGLVDGQRSQWDRFNRIVDKFPHLHEAHHEAHCREAVMWWTHHLAEKTRESLRLANVTVPLLPEGAKKDCGHGAGAEEEQELCAHVNEKNSCDWCHSTQAAHDAGVPGTSVPDGTKKFTGPDDGNPKGWDRKRRCDQDGMPRCQLCEGIGGRAWSDKNEDIDLTTCEVVANASDVDPKTVAQPIYPRAFTVKRKDGKQGGYSDTLIGWKTDPFCFGFFPQNDSIKPLCYRSEDSLVKYYDIDREATRIDYTVHNSGVFGAFPNITSTILMVQDTMWIQNNLWGVHQCICANPSGNHCETPPCKSYIHRYDTFKTAQYLGREKINVEWIQNHGTGKFGKPMELDHFILWSHHVWTDPVSKRLVRAWKPFNGLQVYDPEAWVDEVTDPSVFEAPPALCKKGGAKVRINCDDDGNYHPKKAEGLEHLDSLFEMAVKKGPDALSEFANRLYTAKQEEIVI
jgi:hypothetical protein